MPYQSYQAVCDATGAATITVRPRSAETWRVTQVAPEMLNVTSGASCSIRINGSLVTPVVAGGDAAGGAPAIDVGPADALTIEWLGGVLGRVCKATVFYDQLAA